MLATMSGHGNVVHALVEGKADLNLQNTVSYCFANIFAALNDVAHFTYLVRRHCTADRSP
jgi:hypothetical protein